MNISRVFLILCAILAISISFSNLTVQAAKTEKPPEVIQGGLWNDHFYNPQFVSGDNIDVQMSKIFLKFDELLHWIQTWTAHFASGDFFQTEAIIGFRETGGRWQRPVFRQRHIYIHSILCRKAGLLVIDCVEIFRDPGWGCPGVSNGKLCHPRRRLV